MSRLCQKIDRAIDGRTIEGGTAFVNIELVLEHRLFVDLLFNGVDLLSVNHLYHIVVIIHWLDELL